MTYINYCLIPTNPQKDWGQVDPDNRIRVQDLIRRIKLKKILKAANLLRCFKAKVNKSYNNTSVSAVILPLSPQAVESIVVTTESPKEQVFWTSLRLNHQTILPKSETLSKRINLDELKLKKSHLMKCFLNLIIKVTHINKFYKKVKLHLNLFVCQHFNTENINYFQYIQKKKILTGMLSMAMMTPNFGLNQHFNAPESNSPKLLAVVAQNDRDNLWDERQNFDAEEFHQEPPVDYYTTFRQKPLHERRKEGRLQFGIGMIFFSDGSNRLRNVKKVDDVADAIEISTSSGEIGAGLGLAIDSVRPVKFIKNHLPAFYGTGTACFLAGRVNSAIREAQLKSYLSEANLDIQSFQEDTDQYVSALNFERDIKEQLEGVISRCKEANVGYDQRYIEFKQQHLQDTKSIKKLMKLKDTLVKDLSKTQGLLGKRNKELQECKNSLSFLRSKTKDRRVTNVLFDLIDDQSENLDFK